MVFVVNSKNIVSTILFEFFGCGKSFFKSGQKDSYPPNFHACGKKGNIFLKIFNVFFHKNKQKKIKINRQFFFWIFICL